MVNSAGMAMISPAAVVISAWAMPAASPSARPDPAVATTPKIWIMPSTVPRRPSSGAPPTMVASAPRPRWSPISSRRPVSSRISLSSS
jgi:hypothetical protein